MKSSKIDGYDLNPSAFNSIINSLNTINDNIDTITTQLSSIVNNTEINNINDLTGTLSQKLSYIINQNENNNNSNSNLTEAKLFEIVSKVVHGTYVEYIVPGTYT